MQYDPTRPIWLQVMSALETEIVSGLRGPGEKLPGGRDLALRFEINPNTAARVYQEMEKKGITETRRGMGTYVTQSQDRILSLRAELVRQAVQDFLAKMNALGVSRQEAAQAIMKEEG